LNWLYPGRDYLSASLLALGLVDTEIYGWGDIGDLISEALSPGIKSFPGTLNFEAKIKTRALIYPDRILRYLNFFSFKKGEVFIQHYTVEQGLPI
jgi:hypothetical protein